MQMNDTLITMAVCLHLGGTVIFQMNRKKYRACCHSDKHLVDLVYAKTISNNFGSQSFIFLLI